MRGKGLNPPRYSGICRITPAYAGKSMPVNPKKDKRVGSPPHMRGKVATGRQTVCRCGITPAYAGKRGLRKRGSRNPADHPRICGEKWDKLPSETKQKGSPPHMRGKDVKLTMNAGQLRITPAYAGKSSPWLSGFCRLLGSPPHMRGKVLPSPILAAPIGITPAYAGKSSERMR